MLSRLLITGWLALLVTAASGQAQLYLPLESGYIMQIEKQLPFKSENPFHTSVRPYRHNDLSRYIDIDTAHGVNENPLEKTNLLRKAWYKATRDNLIKVDEEDFRLTIDPLFNVAGMHSFDPMRSGFTNTRGFLIEGGIGDKVSFSTTFYENQSRFPAYLERYIRDSAGVVPGLGRVRNFKGSGAHDYASSQAYVSWEMSKHFTLQFGHGKNFFGDGHRSLLLSDAGFNYPFLKLTTDVWKLKYVNLWTQFQDLGSRSFTLGFQRKYGSFHYLSWNVTKQLQIGLFEGIIWQASDSTGHRGLDMNYVNPVIFMRPVEFALGSPDNAVMGLNVKYHLAPRFIVYGQFVIDDLKFSELKKGNGFFGQKVGWQGGYKYFDLFDVPGLYVQAEHNSVQPYTYAHKVPVQSYSHYNQALAHPLGANFQENILILGYNKNRWRLRMKLVGATMGLDTVGMHKGQNIFVSDYNIPNYPNSVGNRVTQGIETTFGFVEISGGFIINPRTNMMLWASYTTRQLNSDVAEENDSFINFGIRTALRNLVFDF